MRESSSKVKIFKNFKEKKSFKPEFGAENIFGGQLLGVRGSNCLSFYDWESLELTRRIEASVKNVSVCYYERKTCTVLYNTGYNQNALQVLNWGVFIHAPHALPCILLVVVDTSRSPSSTTFAWVFKVLVAKQLPTICAIKNSTLYDNLTVHNQLFSGSSCV